MLLSLSCGCPVDAAEPPCSCASDYHEAGLDAVADEARQVGRDAARAAQSAEVALDLSLASRAEALAVTRGGYARRLAAAIVAALHAHADLDEAAEAAADGVAAGWADVFRA